MDQQQEESKVPPPGQTPVRPPSEPWLAPSRNGRHRWAHGPGDPDVQTFLAGPRARWAETLRVMRIAAEFIRGFRQLHFVGPCVTVFGSARFKEDNRYYQMAREVGRRTAELG